jgi:hypothetical protein
MFVPLVLVNILLVIGTTAGSWLVFPIIAATGSGIVGTVRHVTTLVRESPARLIVYFIFAGLIVLLVILIAWPLVGLGVTQTFGLIGISTGLDVIDNISRGGLLDMIFGFVNPSASAKLASLLFGLQVAVLAAAAGLVVPWVFSLSAGSAVYASLAGTSADEPTRQSSAFGREKQAGTRPSAGFPGMSLSGEDASPTIEQTTVTPPDRPSTAGTPSPGPIAPPVEDDPSPQMVPCISCTRALEAGARFCPYCGTQQR